MGFRVIMVSGPRRAGKSLVIARLIDEVCAHQPHYLRMAAKGGPKKAPRSSAPPQVDCGVSSATWVNYDSDRAFEVLPDALASIHRRERSACVVVEADCDPNLRHAYPYDCRVFVMPAPEDVHQIFRTPQQVRSTLRSVLHDTSVFAGEVFGLGAAEDAPERPADDSRAAMSDTQMGFLLNSPLGAEIATRVQCHPEYHDLVESDVVVLNTGVGGTTLAVDEAVGRLEILLRKTHPAREARPIVFCCDISDQDDPRRQKFIDHMQTVFEGPQAQ